MHNSKSWKGLSKWSYFHHFFHFYNSSETLPTWFYTLRIIITFLQTYPILFGITLIINSDENEIFTAIEYLSNLFLFFSFSTTEVTIGFLIFFCFFSLIIFLIGFFSDTLIFNKVYSIIIHFILEILSPILFNLSGATLQKQIDLLVLGQPNYFFFVASLITSVIFLLFYSLVTYAQSNSVYFTNFYFESWSSWNIYHKTIAPTLILLVMPLRARYYRVGFYVVDCLIVVYCLASLIADSLIPFLNTVVNISFLIVDIFFFLVSILHIFSFEFSVIDSSINLSLIIILLIISLPLAEAVYNLQSKRFNKILQKAIEDAENSDEAELITAVDDDEGGTKYASYLANDKVSILLIRHLTMNRQQ